MSEENKPKFEIVDHKGEPLVKPEPVEDASEESAEENADEEETAEKESSEEESSDDSEEASTEESEEEDSEEESNNDDLDLSDEQVLSIIRKKTGNNSFSWENLSEERKLDLPSDVEAFRKFREETGRSIDDFVKLSRDLDKEDPDSLIRDLIIHENPDFDAEDVAFEMKRRFGYDEDVDDEDEIRSKNLEKKRYLRRAKDTFGQLKEKYKAPLETREDFVPENLRENWREFLHNKSKEPEIQQIIAQTRQKFATDTEKFFKNKDFKGFEFQLSKDKKSTFEVRDIPSTLQSQLSVNNLMYKTMGIDQKTASVTDIEKYHKAFYAAQNIEAIVKWAYDQGGSDKVAEYERIGKNLPNGTRQEKPGSKNTGVKHEVIS